MYRFTQADIDAAAAQGVTMTLSGLPVSDFDGFSDSDTLVATASGGRKFTIIPASGFDPAYTSIYFYGWNPSEGENMNISFVLSDNDTVATLKPTAGMNFSSFHVTTQAAAVALSWVNHPSSGSENTDLIFTWDGGELTTGNYNVVVTKDGSEIVNTTTTNKTYTLNQPSGDYVVTVYDKGGKSDPTYASILSAVLRIIEGRISSASTESI